MHRTPAIGCHVSTRILSAALVCLLCSAVGACGSTAAPQLADGRRSTAQDELALARARQWQEILVNPGQPGVDYLPNRLTVTFKPGARLAASLPAVSALPVGRRAADQGNAMLRVDHSYETLADDIAARYNLKYRNQVYNHAVRMVGFELPPGANGDQVIQDIRSNYGGQLDYVTYTRLRHLNYTPNDPDVAGSTDMGGLAWHILKLHCPDAWDVTTGSDQVRIAILDTGVNLSHEELDGPVLNPTVFFPAAQCDPGRGDNDVTDTYSHGSGTAGLAVAIQDDNKTMTGLAPGCRVIPIRVADENNALSQTAIVEGGYLAQTLGAKIISMSFGGYFTDPTEEAMIADLHTSGMLLFASAGNEDTTDNAYPASYTGCVSVGASNVDDARISHVGWWGSDYGPFVAICAPGEDYESCSIPTPTSYQDFGGTSGACPLVASSAALAWTVHPEWTNDQVRDALIATGMPTTGFNGSVPRVDIGNFMAQYGKGFRIPTDSHLIAHGTVHITPEVFSGLTDLKAFVDGTQVQDLSAAPWDLNLDTSSHAFGPATFRFDGSDGVKSYSSSYNVIVDNGPAVYPLFDSCDAADSSVLPLDMRTLNPAAQGALYLLNPQISATTLASKGPGSWQLVTDGAFKGSSYYCGQASGSYGPDELDCLLCRQLDLTTVTTPTLTFMQRYNLEDGGQAYDRAYVMVSGDYGLTWQPAKLQSGQPAMFTGLQHDWAPVKIDLSAFVGTHVHVAFVMMSDDQTSGEDILQPSGWWVDEIAFSADYSGQPQFSGLNIGNFGVGGAVPQISKLGVKLVNPQNVTKVRYTLDCAPLNQPGGNDQQVDTAPDAPGLLSLPLGTPNQVAQLTIQSFGAGDLPGQQQTVPVYVFNHRGDVNGDGVVGQADLSAYIGKIGLTSTAPGYIPFLDTNFDGTITEADASAVGYFWGSAGS